MIIRQRLKFEVVWQDDIADIIHLSVNVLICEKCFCPLPRLFEEKRRDIIFGFPSFRPPIEVCTLCAHLLLQFYSDSFETLQIFDTFFAI